MTAPAHEVEGKDVSGHGRRSVSVSFWDVEQRGGERLCGCFPRSGRKTAYRDRERA